MNIISRYHEFQADAFAVKLGYAEALKTGLIGLHRENKVRQRSRGTVVNLIVVNVIICLNYSVFVDFLFS